MGAAKKVAEAAPEPQAPATIKVRGCSHLPPGCGINSFRDVNGALREDPGRYRAGGYWPNNRMVERELTWQQLEEVLADEHLEIHDETGALLSTPKADPAAPPKLDELTLARQRIAQLEALLRDAEGRTVMAVQVAQSDAAKNLDRVRAGYDKEIAMLRAETGQAQAQQGAGWFPQPKRSGAQDIHAAHQSAAIRARIKQLETELHTIAKQPDTE